MVQVKGSIVQALVTATRATLDQIRQNLKERTQTKEQALREYAERKRELLPQLLEAHEKGVATRELQKITGISHTTIARWIKAAKQEKEKQNVSTN